MRFRLLELGPRRSRHESPGRASAAAAARFELASCSRSTISIRVAQAHPICHHVSPTRASVSVSEMGSSPQPIFSVDPID